MNNRIKMKDSKFKSNIFLFLSVTVFMARLSIDAYNVKGLKEHNQLYISLNHK
jgi:hypothetical protein